MTQITEGVYFIKGLDEFIPDSHTYVVGKPSSHDLSLIDPGLMGKGKYKIQSIQDMGIELKAIKRIIMTHTHLDHIGCLPEMREQIPWAELWVHEIEAGPLEEGDERTVYGMICSGACARCSIISNQVPLHSPWIESLRVAKIWNWVV